MDHNNRQWRRQSNHSYICHVSSAVASCHQQYNLKTQTLTTSISQRTHAMIMPRVATLHCRHHHL